LGALALLGTALVAWVTADEGWRWCWIALNRASLVVMAAYVAETPGPLALVWSLVTFSLGSGLLAVGQAIRTGWRWQLPAWVAGLALWGFPGTPGFLARTVLILPTDLAVAAPLFVIILVAETLLAAALWQAVTGVGIAPHAVAGASAQPPFGMADENLTPSTPPSLPGKGDGGLGGRIFRAVISTPTGEDIIRLSLALGLLAAPVIAWGLIPLQLAGLAGLPAGQAFPTLLWLLLHLRRSVWTGLLLSGIAGAGLGLLRKRIFARMRGWQQGITAVVSLEWLYRGIAAGLALAGSGLQYFATLGEGEGYLGWLALAALILWVLLRG
jgi:hypothetical protein